MILYNANGKSEPTLRHFNSLKFYVGENRTYKCGDVLYISTKNNDNYDLCIMADGVSDFRVLVKKAAEKSSRILVTEEGDTLRIKVLDD